MATTETIRRDASRWGDGWLVTAVDLSTILPDEPVDVEHAGPSGASCDYITYDVRTRATTGSPVVQVSHEAANDSTTNNTCRIRVSTLPGGDLTGAVVRVFFHFAAAAAGGIS